MLLNKNELEKNILVALPDLKKYWELLLIWQKSVNLISSKTMENGWERHILDSAQLYVFISNQQHTLMDVGSGAGLPGIVIAILNKVLKGPLKKIVLVESDMKKTLFLKECARQLDLDIEVQRERIERVTFVPDVITARAFAPLSELLELVKKNVSRETILLLPKGKNVEEEIKMLEEKYETEKLKNIINSEGCILKMKKGDL